MPPKPVKIASKPEKFKKIVSSGTISDAKLLMHEYEYQRPDR